MQYHYERCTGNAPQFKCDQCERTYESRTGLNYHMSSSHINESNEDNKVNIFINLIAFQNSAEFLVFICTVDVVEFPS